MYDDATRGHETPDRPAESTSNQRLLADGGTTEVCPECDRPGIRQRMLEKPNSCSDGPRWRCDECGATFDEPVEREKRDHSGRRGLANQLIHAEQGDLVTDGGEPANEDEHKTGSWIGTVQGLKVRETAPGSDGALLEVHGEDGMVAMKFNDEAFVEGLTHAAAEIQTILNDLPQSNGGGRT